MPKLSDWSLPDEPESTPQPAPDWRPRKTVRRAEKAALREAGRQAFLRGEPRTAGPRSIIDGMHWDYGYRCAEQEARTAARVLARHTADYVQMFEVLCDTVFGPLPKLTPRFNDRGPRGQKKGQDTPLAWVPGAERHQWRLGHVEYDWRDL